MCRTIILNNEQVQRINGIYNTKLSSIMIKQEKNKFYAILDCDIKFRLKEKEAISYFK